MSTSAVSSSSQTFDVNGIVNSLMSLEARSLTSIQTRISTTQVSVSSMSEVKGLVDAAYNAVKSLNSSSLLNGKSVTSSSEALVKASISDTSLAGGASVPVQPVQLARAQRSTLAGFQSVDTALSASDFGTLTIDVPSGSSLLSDADGDGVPDSFTPVQIALGGQTLTQIRDSINSQLSGKVSASIVYTGDPTLGYVLVLSGAKTGADGDFTAALDDGTVNARATSGLKIGGMVAAQATQSLGVSVSADVAYDSDADDAYATLFAGTNSQISVRSATNSFSAALPGVTFEILKVPGAGETSQSTITVADNVTDVQGKLTTFASAMTDLIKRLRVLTAPATADKKAGPLASNSGVMGLESSLLASYSKGLTLTGSRTYTTASGNVIGTSTRPISWSQLGLSMARDGTVSLDASVLSTTLASSLGTAIRLGFDANLTSVLSTFRGTAGTVQGTIDIMNLSLSDLQTRKTAEESRLERTRQSLVRKYSALDAQLTTMSQLSNNVRSALAGLSA